MKNIYYKSDIGNFGDDLNEWLWPQIFKNINLIEDDTYFIGIGSILNDTIEHTYKLGKGVKIVFGTGVRPSLLSSILSFDNTWDVMFLRGPLSSQVFDDKYEYITDAAYTLRQLDTFEQLRETEKKYDISLMPYFRSLDYFDWKNICKQLGYHYISPCSEHGVEFTIKEIAASQKLITEAMHGAIVADVLRVPWRRFIFSTYDFEYPDIAEFKWNDWLLSINLTNIKPIFIPFYMKNRITNWVRRITNNLISMEFYRKRIVEKVIIDRLKDKGDQYYNSSDLMIKRIDNEIAKKVIDFKNTY